MGKKQDTKEEIGTGKPFNTQHKGKAPELDIRDPYLPDDHLVWAIAATIMCCNPFGIIAIFKSRQVNKLFIEDKFEAAKEASDATVLWIVGSVAISAIIWFVILMCSE